MKPVTISYGLFMLLCFFAGMGFGELFTRAFL